jgi:hypothetical protein
MPAFNGPYLYLPLQNNAPLGIMYHTLPAQCWKVPSKEPPPDKDYNEQSQPSKRAILRMVSHKFSQMNVQTYLLEHQFPVDSHSGFPILLAVFS